MGIPQARYWGPIPLIPPELIVSRLHLSLRILSDHPLRDNVYQLQIIWCGAEKRRSIFSSKNMFSATPVGDGSSVASSEKWFNYWRNTQSAGHELPCTPGRYRLPSLILSAWSNCIVSSTFPCSLRDVTATTTTRQSWIADFAPGFYTARCRPPTNGSVPHVVIANASCAQFAATAYNDKVEQCSAPWRIRWKFMTTCSSTALE